MFKMVNRLKNKKGFTLIELIVVLAVLGIIAVIAVPRFLNVQENSRLSSDETAVAGIQKASEIYAAQENVTDFTTITIDLLQGENLLDTAVMLQSASFSGNIETSTNITDIDFDANTDGVLQVTITANDGSIIQFP
jgi:type IV pilus assembly protein PilA